MQAPFEFQPNNRLAGFRLDRLEVFNWGTFHGKIWSIEPAGGTSLLTGANGSGKSTLVDALLTLLVPNTKRGYNLASGAASKKERNERSYVRGAFGKYKGDESQQSMTRYLRDKNDYSVVLGAFKNEGTQQKIALAQVFYTQNDSLQKFFVVAPGRLTIADDFSGFKNINRLRHTLRGKGADVYDQFNEYSKQFRRAFGLRSEKALDLFNQTISIKAIRDLNSFVRNHMLEAADIGDTIDALRRHFDDLTHTYEAIKKAKVQRDLLRPIVKIGQKHEEFAAEVQRYTYGLQAVPGYFARAELGLLATALSENDARHDQVRLDLEVTEKEVHRLRARERDIDIAISKDAAGQELHTIEQEIQRTSVEKDRVRAQWDRFQKPVEAMEWAMPADDGAFQSLLEKAKTTRRAVESEREQLIPERDELIGELTQTRVNLQESERELESLRRRKNQIPSVNLQIRQRVLDALGLKPEELPFIGELIKVKEEEREWEGAAERLLHSFALRILVPDAHYRKVNDFVNKAHLNGRIVYARIPAKAPTRHLRDANPDRLYNKLEIQPETPYREWLYAEITRSYDHLCCSVEDFEHEKRALTRNGLIKQNGTLHEKNDRHRIDDASRYVLGWNNREKIRAFEADIARLSKKTSALAEQQRAIETRQRELQEVREQLADLLRYAHFSEIDWSRLARRIQVLEDQKKQLEASANHLQRLRETLQEVRNELASSELQVKALESEITLLADKRQRYEKRRAQCSELLNLFPEEKLNELASVLEEYLGADLDLDSLSDERERLRKMLDDRRQQVLDKQAKTATRLVSAMRGYIQTYDITEADASPESLPDFQRFLDTIEREDLPRHEKKFRELLKTKLMEDISFFEHALFRQEEEIHEKVTALNKSLLPIPYTPSTYIQLHAKPTQDVEIRDFKRLLRDVFDGHEDTADAHEATFHKIHNLIQRFNEDDRWTRKVTDVRYWLDFHISERSSESDAEINYITDSAGLSGGQKAKLAYTILASAIAYQFGLDYGETRSNSFRFVVIDEAFSKIDEANAQYAMNLFQQLDLQLLVVSPLGSTRVVEDYITACHFVANNSEGNDSQVRNLSIGEYMEEKARLAVAAGIGG